MKPARRSLWAGRALALLGILLVALNVRTAVASLSPITAHVSVELPLDALALSLIGMVPPMAFALAGVFAPFVARRLGLEATLALAAAAMAAGTVLRAVAGDFLVLYAGSALALLGMGFGNILLPPAVKKYFPDRIGSVTAIYVSLVSVSAAVPPVLAVPVAEAAGWRVSLGQWALLALLGLLPWLVLWLRRWAADRRASRHVRETAVLEAEPVVLSRLWRSPTAWAITIACGLSSVTFYAMSAWLPELLISRGIAQLEAAALLALFAMVGVPMGILVPWLAARMNSSGLLVLVGTGFLVLGYLGLLLVPEPALAPVWVVALGAGTMLFPLALTLINLRTRSHQASAALSGFVQGIGYTLAALGPLVVGLLHEATGDWIAPLLLLLGVSLAALACAAVLARNRFVEDEGRIRAKSETQA